MSLVKTNLQENFIFFTRELARINTEIKALPLGNISEKKIGGNSYFYRQWRDGKKVKSIALGKEPPLPLLKGIQSRIRLEAQKKEILKNTKVIAKAINTQRATVDEILRTLAQNDIKAVLIGSYCMPVFKEALGMRLPTIKTQDVDLLLANPYRGKKVDLERLLADLGFFIGFNPDGSNFFTDGIFKIEFLTPEKGKQSDSAIAIKELGIKAIPLRYVQMLLDHRISFKKEGLVYPVPNPWVFAFHKILVSKARKKDRIREKDLLQAISILREIRKKALEFDQATAYMKTLPKKWLKHIKEQLKIHLSEFLEVQPH